MNNNKLQGIIGKIGIYFGIIAVTFIILIPILFALTSSMKENAEIFDAAAEFSFSSLIPQDLNFESYGRLFTEWNFHQPMITTVTLVAASILCGVFINSMAGFAFARFKFRGKSALFTLVFLSFMVPFEAISIPLYGVVRDFSMDDTFWALLLPMIANGLVIFLFKQFFEELPESLMESAIVDGAGWFRIYGRIALPLSKPVIISGALLMFVTQWSAFLWPLIAARSDDLKVIQVAISEFMQQYGTFWSEMFAAAIISFIIPLMLLLPFQKYYISSIANTGGKE